MADKKVQITVAAKGEGADELAQLARELDAIGKSGGDAAPEAQKLADELRKLGAEKAAVGQFVALKKETGELRAALDTARAKTAELGREIAAADKPTAQMTREFEQAKKASARLETQLGSKQSQLNALRKEFRDTGVATTDLAQHDILLAASIKQAVAAAQSFPEKLKAAASAAEELAAKEKEAADQAKLQKQAFDGAVAETKRLRIEFDNARATATRLGNELASTANPSIALRREFEGAVRTTTQLEGRLKANQSALAQTRASMVAAKLSTADLEREQVAVVHSLDQASVAANSYGSALRRVIVEQNRTVTATKETGDGLGVVASSLKTAALAAAGAATTDAVFGAMLSMEGLHKALVTVTGSEKAAGREMEYIRGVADRLGIPVEVTAQSWIRFSAAAKGTALEGQKARAVFESVASAMSRMGRSGEDISGALLALEQMISKGVVSSEELKQQLGERLPGAFKLAANAVGVTETELNKLLETGAITADELLPRLAAELNKTFGDPEKKVTGLGASWQRLKDSLFGAAGDNGNGLLGGTLTKLFDDLTGKTKQTNVHLAEMDKHLDQAGANFQSGKIIAGIKGIGSAAVDATKSLLEWSPTGLLMDKWAQLTGKTKEAVEATKAVAPAARAATVAQNAQGQSLARLALDLATAKTAFEAEAKAIERGSKARIDQAKAAVAVAQANEDESAALSAKVALADAESDAAAASLNVKNEELALAARELSVLDAQLASRQRVTEADRQKVIAQRDKIEAIKAEIVALDAASRAAEANAEAAKRAASETEAAFKVLGLQSQRELKKGAAKAKAAYETIRDAAASGAASQKDVQAAFLAYAKQALQTGDAVSNAGLQTQAAINGVEQEYAKLAETASKTSGAAKAGLDGIGETGRRVGQQLAEGADKVIDGTNRMAKAVANDTGSVAAWMAQFVDGLYSNLGKMSTAAMNEFAKMQGAAGRIDTSKSQTQVERLTDAMHKSQEEMGRFQDVMYSGSDGVGINIGLARIAIAAKGVEVRFYEQAIAAEQLRESLEKMDVTTQSAEMSADNLVKQFDLMDASQLTGLRDQVEQVNSKIRETRAEAARATDALNGMAESAQDSIDRANGNQLAIERRKLQEEMAKIDELAAQGGDAGAAAQAKARIKKAYDIRAAEIEAEQKAERDRKAGDVGGAGGQTSVNTPPIINRPSAQGQGQPAQAAPVQPSRLVQIDLSVNGQRQSVNVASDADAETLVRTLEDLKRRMR